MENFLGIRKIHVLLAPFVVDTMKWKSYNLENEWDTFEKINRKEI